jgi:hypothetical protein
MDREMTRRDLMSSLAKIMGEPDLGYFVPPSLSSATQRQATVNSSSKDLLTTYVPDHKVAQNQTVGPGHFSVLCLLAVCPLGYNDLTTWLCKPFDGCIIKF